MKRPHRSPDLRERALAAVDAGRPMSEIEAWFGVDARSVQRWKQWRATRGSLATKTPSGRTPKIAPEQHPALVAQVAAHPDATLADHADLWEAATGVRVSASTLSRLFAKLRITLKKRP
jgi:transposase